MAARSPEATARLRREVSAKVATARRSEIGPASVVACPVSTRVPRPGHARVSVSSRSLRFVHLGPTAARDRCRVTSPAAAIGPSYLADLSLAATGHGHRLATSAVAATVRVAPTSAAIVPVAAGPNFLAVLSLAAATFLVHRSVILAAMATARIGLAVPTVIVHGLRSATWAVAEIDLAVPMVAAIGQIARASVAIGPVEAIVRTVAGMVAVPTGAVIVLAVPVALESAVTAQASATAT
jgi:hypothetical protein